MKFLQQPISPLEIDKNSSIPELLERMGGISFQGRNLARAFSIWREMLRGEVTIFLGLAGAMVPAGMRRVILYLIQNRLIDCLVSTGANLFHDVHETLGNFHWRGEPWADDRELRKYGINRIYDTFASEEEFRETDRFIAAFAQRLDLNKSYTTREFLHLLGEDLIHRGKEEGILTSAARFDVPIYCPAIADSSIGIALTLLHPNTLTFDLIGDVRELGQMVAQAPTTGVVFIGGGVPKNFIQQAEITASVLGWNAQGHEYAIQIITDPPHWGGLSGCTLEEAQSWGKVAQEARKVTLYCDATIALPLLVTALAQEEELIRSRKERIWARSS